MTAQHLLNIGDAMLKAQDVANASSRLAAECFAAEAAYRSAKRFYRLEGHRESGSGRRQWTAPVWSAQWFEIQERHYLDNGYGMVWTNTPWHETFPSREAAYRAICEQLNAEPGYTQIEDGHWDVHLAHDHIYQIFKV